MPEEIKGQFRLAPFLKENLSEVVIIVLAMTVLKLNSQKDDLQQSLLEREKDYYQQSRADLMEIRTLENRVYKLEKRETDSTSNRSLLPDM